MSKEAAAATLLDDNVATIVAAVEEGRIVFGTIKKYLTYLLSSNVGEIVLMAGAALTGLPLPLTAVQILYVNLATDGLPALALAVDPPEPDLMTRKPRGPRVGVRPGGRIGEDEAAGQQPIRSSLRGDTLGSIKELREVIALAESGRLTTIPIEVAPLEDINEVYRRLKRGEIAGRAVIAPAA